MKQNRVSLNLLAPKLVYIVLNKELLTLSEPVLSFPSHHGTMFVYLSEEIPDKPQEPQESGSGVKEPNAAKSLASTLMGMYPGTNRRFSHCFSINNNKIK